MNGLTYLIELEPGQWLGRGVGIGKPSTTIYIRQARRFRSQSWADKGLIACREGGNYPQSKVVVMDRLRWKAVIQRELREKVKAATVVKGKQGRPSGGRRPDTDYGVPLPSRTTAKRIRQLSPDRADFFRAELSRRAYALAKISMGVLREEYDRLRDDVLAFVERAEFDPAEDFNYLHVIGPMESRNGSSLSPAIMRSKGAE